MANEVWFPIEKNSEGYPKSRDWEGLHCDVVDKNSGIFRITNVPFYLKNVSYGDTIKAVLNAKGYFEFDQVVKRSGWSVYRLLVLDSQNTSDTVKKLESMGLELEEENDLIAVAVPPDAKSDAIVDFILEGKRLGLWGAQDGFIFE